MLREGRLEEVRDDVLDDDDDDATKKKERRDDCITSLIIRRSITYLAPAAAYASAARAYLPPRNIS